MIRIYRDIMREIARLKEERDETSRMSSIAAAAAGGMHAGGMMSASGQFMPGARGVPGGPNNPSLVHELRSLRQRKEELEQRMGCLQESRRELMVQLESLMKMLRTGQPVTAAPSSNHSQTLGNFSSNSTTTGESDVIKVTKTNWTKINLIWTSSEKQMWTLKDRYKMISALNLFFFRQILGWQLEFLKIV